MINLAQAYYNQILNISKQYLDSQKSYNQLTEKSEKQMAYLQQDAVNFGECRLFVSLNFQLIGRNFYVNQDNALNFSAFVYHVLVLN